MIFRRISCLLVLGFLTLVSCVKNDDQPTDDMPIVDDDPIGTTDDDPMVEEPETEGMVEFFDASKVLDAYVLVNDASANRAFIMDKNAELIHEWTLSNNIGNDVFLLPNGKLLASLEADEPKITLGGQGGKLQFIAADGTIEWNFEYSSEEAETHHDAELLPNGNVLAMVWEKRTAEQAVMAGSSIDRDLFPDALIEVDPTTDEIVWEWHAWDHLVQEFDDTKENFGSISDNPQLIHLNHFPDEEKGDIMHGNGIAYDAMNNLIYLSVNFFSEVWVIDHSTTTEEAASHTGGNYGKGGDLVYRFGNPEAYNNPMGERLFMNNHHPYLLKDEDQGNIMIYSNGGDLEQSTVYELELPQTFTLEANTDNEPEVVWSFTDPDLFAPRVSGAVKLPNGNRLIAEGDFGLWEVTEAGEVVWKFSADGFFWRAYHYDKDAPEIIALGL
ncbi:MAG: aryl-sulfate sulfotransferase [Flavobacteriaceae bacterium]